MINFALEGPTTLYHPSPAEEVMVSFDRRLFLRVAGLALPGAPVVEMERYCRKGQPTHRRGEGLPNSLHLRDGSRSVVALPSREESNVKPQRRCYENRIHRTVSTAGSSPQMARLVLFQSTQPPPAKKHPA